MKPTAKSNVTPTGKNTQQSRRAAAKKKKTIIISAIAAALAIAIIITVVVAANNKKNFDTSRITTYNIEAITSGNVSTTISGSGSLTPITQETLTAVDLLAELEAIDAKIAEVSAISEEDVLTLTIYDLTEDGAEYTFTDVKDVDLANYAATEETEEYTISSSDVIYTVENKALTEIESTEIVVGDLLVLHEVSDDRTNLIVYHEQSDEDEKQEQQSGNNTIFPGDTSGTEAESIPEIVDGAIRTINVQVGDTVDEGDVLAVIEFETEETRNIIAPYDAVILEFYLHDGDAVTDETSVAMFMGIDGYTMTISVDENNISLIELGQDVEISIDVINENDLTGEVTDISYNGSTSGSTTAYGIVVTFDYVEGTYPGMSVSAEIVIEESDEGLLAPVSAVYTSGDTSYVYLAPGGATEGTEYEEGDIDVSKLTKVTVTMGMSDGTYIRIDSSSLDEGDLIVVITYTSTDTGNGSSGSGSGGMGEFGGFGGGGMGGFPGGDFDFGNFDPSQMPSGGFPFGN